ncbi:MAG: thioredoxin family protein [Nanoarchaeota archaeon]
MVKLESLQKLKKGDKAPDFKLLGIDDKKYSLNDFKDAKALMIIFMCNHCPYVKAKTDVMNKLYEKFHDKGLVMVGINANDPEDYPDDSFGNMKRFAYEKGIKFYYLVDETQKVAKNYGASCTPDPFLFKNVDGEFKLVYHGRFDNAMEPGDEATSKEMEDAIESILKNKEVKKAFVPSIGCSIKWRE